MIASVALSHAVELLVDFSHVTHAKSFVLSITPSMILQVRQVSL